MKSGLNCFVRVSVALCLLSGAVAAEDRTVAVRKDTLFIELIESGEITAVNSTVVAAPRLWNQELQITELAPEGSHADSGQVLVRFDRSSLQARLEEKQTELGSRQAEYRKMLVEQEASIRNLERALEISEFTRKLAEVRLEQLQYASRSKREEGELEVMKAKVAYKEAATKLKSQKIIHSSARQKQELLILQAQGEVNRRRSELAQLELRAPLSGLVLHHTDWNGNRPQEGGKIRPGAGVIDLPDLSRMQVKIAVNEIDAAKLAGMPRAILHLEAFPEKQFSAVMRSLTTIANAIERNSQVRAFVAVFEISDADSLLKPGMTATVAVRLDTLAGAKIVPAAAIYELKGDPVVFLDSDPGKGVPIRVVARNDGLAAVDGIPENARVLWNAGDPNARRLGYAQYEKHIRLSPEARAAFFTEMQSRELIFDYEDHRETGAEKLQTNGSNPALQQGGAGASKRLPANGAALQTVAKTVQTVEGGNSTAAKSVTADTSAGKPGHSAADAAKKR